MNTDNKKDNCPQYGAAECGDCNTCNKCEEQQTQQDASALYHEAINSAAAKDYNSFEKNLTKVLSEQSHDRLRGTLQTANGGYIPQYETFSRNAVSRPVTPGFEGAQLNPNHEGLSLYTLIIYSENFAGILNQITAVFTRRQVNIESLNVCSSSTPGVHKYTITCYCKHEMAEMLTKQIEKKIDVLQANCFVDDEIFILETSLLKLSTPLVLANQEISRTVRRHNAKIVEVNPTYTIVEKTGVTADVLEHFNSLNALGCVLQFVRSGRIAITRSCIERLDQYIAKREAEEEESAN